MNKNELEDFIRAQYKEKNISKTITKLNKRITARFYENMLYDILVIYINDSKVVDFFRYNSVRVGDVPINGNISPHQMICVIDGTFSYGKKEDMIRAMNLSIKLAVDSGITSKLELSSLNNVNV